MPPSVLSHPCVSLWLHGCGVGAGVGTGVGAGVGTRWHADSFDAPGDDVIPNGHDLHVVAPRAEAYLSAAHIAHDVEPDAVANRPAAQSWQSNFPPFGCERPFAHILHDDAAYV